MSEPLFLSISVTSGASLIALAALAFVTTNLDDLVALVAFSRQYRPVAVLIGQVVGFGVLIAASLLLAALARVALGPWIGLLGLVPIAVGVAAFRSDGWLPFDGKDARENGQVSVVAAVGIANGADNLAVYVPLFAVLSVVEAGVVAAVMIVLAVAWVGLAYAVALRSPVGRLLRSADWLVPLLFVIVGLSVLVESGLLTHLAG